MHYHVIVVHLNRLGTGNRGGSTELRMKVMEEFTAFHTALFTLVAVY